MPNVRNEGWTVRLRATCIELRHGNVRVMFGTARTVRNLRRLAAADGESPRSVLLEWLDVAPNEQRDDLLAVASDIDRMNECGEATVVLRRHFGLFDEGDHPDNGFLCRDMAVTRRRLHEYFREYPVVSQALDEAVEAAMRGDKRALRRQVKAVEAVVGPRREW